MATNSQQRSVWWMLIPALLICAPLVSVAAVFMAYKLGFFIGGSALAGIIASGFAFVIYRNRLQGAHAANMGQTAASACGSLAGIVAVLLQAFYWIGVGDDFSVTSLMIYTGACSMLGIGIGMSLTPLLVDRMQLPYPTGFAVFQILRAMMTWENFKKAIKWLGAGIAAGLYATKKGIWGKVGFDAATTGAGMIAGPRIAFPGLVMGLIGLPFVAPMLAAGWIEEGQEFRNVAFYGGLTMMLGAAIVHIIKMGIEARSMARKLESTEKGVLPMWVKAWTLVWALITIATGVIFMDIGVGYLVVGILMAAIFVIVNGISTGISDSNPVTGAFVLTILGIVTLTSVGDKMTALMAGSVTLYTIAIGVDMQQDRSTGARLGSDRTTQFWFQVVGVLGALVLSFTIAPFFLESYPELMDPSAETENWSSAFTMKIVGALSFVEGGNEPYKMWLMAGGLVFGVILELLRIRFEEQAKENFWIDTFVIPSPYAFAFGAFVPFVYTVWFAVGGLLAIPFRGTARPEPPPKNVDLEALSSFSARSIPALIGGGLVAGAALAYLWMGFSNM